MSALVKFRGLGNFAKQKSVSEVCERPFRFGLTIRTVIPFYAMFFFLLLLLFPFRFSPCLFLSFHPKTKEFNSIFFFCSFSTAVAIYNTFFNNKNFVDS